MEYLREMTVDGILYSTDKKLLQIGFVYDFLSLRSYWAGNIPAATVETSIENSLCVGMYTDGKQVGFARIITDFATFGYLADVFVDENFRGQGISKKLMEFIFTFSFVPGLRRMLLATLDAHGLYSQFGFVPLENPDRIMEINQPKIYQKQNGEY